VRFGHGSWFDALPDELRGTLALVVSNPPYIAHGDAQVAAVVRDWEPHAALFADENGLADVRAVVVGAIDWLIGGGWLVSEIDSAQGAAVCELMTSAGLTDVEILQDLAGRDRIAVGRRVP
jgi:release factor glutamine methyltransferase